MPTRDTPAPAAPSGSELEAIRYKLFGNITPPHTHDAMCRALVKARPAEVLRAGLPAGLLEQIDFNIPLEVIDPGQTNEFLGDTRCDAVIKVTFKRRVKTPEGEDVQDWGFIIVEHKSFKDPRTILQLRGYELGILVREAAKRPLSGLSQVDSLVLYHGEPVWDAAGSLEEMRRYWSGLGLEPPEREYALVDFGRTPAEELTDDPAVWAGFTAMRFATRGDGRQGEPYFAEILKRLEDDNLLQRQVKFYIMEKWGFTEAELIALEKAANLKIGGENIMQSAGDIIRAECMTQGIAQGMAQGMTRGMANVVIRLLGQRFGDLPERVVARVAGASTEELDLWAGRILTAKSLDAVFTN